MLQRSPSSFTQVSTPRQVVNAMPNRLIHETSPYLLQHAHNPVDWYPWSQDAFDEAKRRGVPVFLSVGYSACHWCHVMEHESFEDEDIARQMNDNYVCIKVDREERPDIDQIYMTSVQLITQRGGWPMSVFLDHDAKPFYGGTYWPKSPKHGMPGFGDVLNRITTIWKQHPDDVEKAGLDLQSEIQRLGTPDWEPSVVGKVAIENAVVLMLKSADRRHGGFGTAPKFPHPMDLRVLMRAVKRFGNLDALDVVRLTLDKMARGGIYDHLGGGFARYSTDAYWLVPHFEKMLYDNALLLTCYLEGFQLTGDEFYKQVAREICEYILRDMTSPEGGFYATEDADSEGVEGKFYVWSEAEIDEILGSEESRVFKHCYDVTTHGNWEESNILNLPKPLAVCAEELSLPIGELQARLACSRAYLFEAREKRIHPGKDTKILASWNGLMIAALAQASVVLQEPKYAQVATNAARFILARMVSEESRLLHSYKDGQARFNGYLDDYACLIDGLTELTLATGEASFAISALQLAQRMLAQFTDPSNGTFFYTSADHETLIARQQDIQDNATPSGYSMAVTALLKLGRLLNDETLEQAGMKALEAAGMIVKTKPYAVAQLLIAADFAVGPTWELVIFPGDDQTAWQQVQATLAERFLPNKLLLIAPKLDASHGPLQPHFESRTAISGQVTLYRCERGRCLTPAVGITDVLKAIADL